LPQGKLGIKVGKTRVAEVLKDPNFDALIMLTMYEGYVRGKKIRCGIPALPQSKQKYP
jgi:hypothetical protein